MKHLGTEYNERIQDTAGKIPEDEPVFLLRGQDELASRAVKFYAQLALENGVAPEQVQAITRQAQAMHLWPHRKKPDALATPDDDVSHETAPAAYAGFHAMLTGVVVDFAAFLTSEEYARTFQSDLDGGDDESPNMSYALMEGMKAWAKAREVDDSHASQDWKSKLFPGYRRWKLDR